MQKSHFLGLFLVHQEVDGLALVAEFTFHDIVTILVELHMESDGIVRTATETVISLMVAPRVDYLLHII